MLYIRENKIHHIFSVFPFYTELHVRLSASTLSEPRKEAVRKCWVIVPSLGTHQYWSPVVSVDSLIFSFPVEVHPGSQEYGQHHPPAQTVEPLPVSDCPNELEVCRGPAEGVSQQGEP